MILMTYFIVIYHFITTFYNKIRNQDDGDFASKAAQHGSC